MEKVKSIKEVEERLAKLPAFTQSVYKELKSALYAEAGFTDVTSCDLAKSMSVKVQAVDAALGHLYQNGLAWSDTYKHDSGDGKGYINTTWLQTYEHSHELK